MADGLKPAWELEQEARATNAEPWEPPSGMAKKQCSQCRYWFAVPIAEAEVTRSCPDCASAGTRPTRPTTATRL